MKTLSKALAACALVALVGCAGSSSGPTGGHDGANSHGPDPSGEAWVPGSDSNRPDCDTKQNVLSLPDGGQIVIEVYTACGNNDQEDKGDPPFEVTGENEKVVQPFERR